jgi:hypothetical protein
VRGQTVVAASRVPVPDHGVGVVVAEEPVGSLLDAEALTVAAAVRISPHGPGLSVVLSSVASTYGFTWFEAGATARDWMYSDGELVVDQGSPLPFEVSALHPSWGPTRTSSGRSSRL